MNDGEEAGTDTGDGQRSLRDDGQEGRPGEGQVLDGQATERYSEKGGDETVGEIYFVQTEDQKYVKIGYSKQVVVRLSQLGTLRPGSFSLKVLGSVPGSPTIERWLHDRFSEDRDNGEWFRKSARLAAFIDSLALIPPVIIERKERQRKRSKLHGLYIQPEPEPAPIEADEVLDSEPTGPESHCLRCGHHWLRRTERKPRACPNCKQSRWDTRSQWSVEVKP